MAGFAKWARVTTNLLLFVAGAGLVVLLAANLETLDRHIGPLYEVFCYFAWGLVVGIVYGHDLFRFLSRSQ